MFASKRNWLIAAAFAVPVFCCFIGIGAFLQVAVSALEQGLKEKASEGEKEGKQLRDAIAAEDRRIAELLRKLDIARHEVDEGRKLDGETAAQRAQLARQLEELEKLRAEIAELERTLEQLRSAGKDRPGQVASKQELERRLREAQQEQRRLVAELDKVQREIEDKEKIHVVTELGAGARHTRKPVYVECVGSGVILQPAGTQLGGDPGDADRNAFVSAASRTGYVVFMIRPDGFRSFNNYRRIITLVNQESPGKLDCGFEPVNADWKLLYPGQKD